MAWWFFRGVRRGVVTTRYPYGPAPEHAADLPTPPAFRPRRLTREIADRMIAACPGGALRRDGDTLVYDVGACTACGRCLAVAGDAAVPSGEFALAATDRTDLIKRIPIRGGRP